MLLIVSAVLAAISFFAARSITNSSPEIALWSVNKKQALSLAWFAMCVLIFTLVKAAMMLDADIVQLLPGSIGISIIFGMIFYKGLSPKKQPV